MKLTSTVHVFWHGSLPTTVWHTSPQTFLDCNKQQKIYKFHTVLHQNTATQIYSNKSPFEDLL